MIWDFAHCMLVFVIIYYCAIICIPYKYFLTFMNIFKKSKNMQQLKIPFEIDSNITLTKLFHHKNNK